MDALTILVSFYYVTCACALKYRRIDDSSIITGNFVGSATQIQTSSNLHCVSSCEHHTGCEIAQFYTNGNICILRTKVVLLYPVNATDTDAGIVTYTNLLGDCDNGWSRFGNSCYLLTWGCPYPGSHDASVTSEDEHRAILQMTQQVHGPGYTIHMGLIGTIGLLGLEWKWTTGEDVGSYTNWAPGQTLNLFFFVGPYVDLVYTDVNVYQWVYTSVSNHINMCELEI